MGDPQNHDSRRIIVQASDQVSKAITTKPGKKVALVASVLSLLVPGLGQAFNGRLITAAAFGLPLPLLLILLSPKAILNTFGGLVTWLLFQLSISVTACISAYRSGLKAASAGLASRVSWGRRIGSVVAAGTCIGLANHAAIALSTTRAYIIPVDSMAPTILKGDRVMADLRFYFGHALQRGDVVVFSSLGGELMTKRVAALGGDTIQGVGGKIYVNRILQQKYPPFDPQQFRLPEYMVNFGPLSIPPGKVFLLGDNLPRSWDSRNQDFGLVDQTSIKGKVLYIYWSTDHSRIGKKVV